ncbi:YojF family protein [Anaerobacillus sp. MEB173]|uniref:YojF family protein n=1 Tax=Anaerobacillus sp. MEB173 TaxID=3383345 RepID=UPI003F92EA58
MKRIDTLKVQKAINQLANQDVYLHLETTNGAYSTHHGRTKINVGAFIKNGKINYEHGKITGDNPFRVGLKLENGWVYAEGLTDWEEDHHDDRLILAGHDPDGKLAVAFQISKQPF